ncbi:LysM peptidoglycan-binding domain-containing protein [Shivajiella indica]|uniref:LysM peptidoglycan-binding domain-containing protein n=1 Tax=Shivajiella indica TaxID=872115 RepID=A0ABW5B7R2_9BACT
MKNLTNNLFKGVIFLSLLFLDPIGTLAQIPQVPREMYFADLTIRINEQARREIQLDVDALHRNQNYFKVKVDRANLYMPLIERELREIGVPEDIKYLVIQESGLIADAVSTSNAVGFWQFKQGTAEEVFLRVDNQVDERKNIVSSTRGAALYLRKHNSQLDNWMCALVSYQMGLGGAKSYFGNQYSGKKVIDLDRNSHWYFKKFLAHKVAFEGQNKMLVSNSGYLEEVRIQGPTSLKALAPRLGVSENHLKEYNKWASNGNIPGDKVYSVIYVNQGMPPTTPITAQVNSRPSGVENTSYSNNSSYPKITGNQQNATRPNQIKVNNINGVMAASTTTQSNFSQKIGIKEKKFRKINDLEKGARVESGKYYYVEKKKSHADVEKHVVLPGETLWSISQKYGITLSSLKAKNRIRSDRDLKTGMVLNLQEHRKRGESIPMVPGSEYRKIVEASNSPAVQTTASQNTQQEREQVRYEPAPSSQSSPQPPAQKVNPSRLTHTVIQGETLYRLSQTYGVSVDDIKKWNNLPDNNIKIGQIITIFKP